jgi:hypothetical protein
MSKPWFKDVLDAAGPHPLAAQIAAALGRPALTRSKTVQLETAKPQLMAQLSTLFLQLTISIGMLVATYTIWF